MLKTRIIPTLLYKDFGLVKDKEFRSVRRVGDVLQTVRVYGLREVDELVLLDVAATRAGRGPDLALVDRVADECFMPLSVGGGVRGLEDIRNLLMVGADKVVLNSAALDRPELISEAASAFGSQCVVVSIDVWTHEDGRQEVYARSGTHPTGHDPVSWARRAEREGAGEILLASINRDGTMTGYDLGLTRMVADAVSIPLIASGGAGSGDDMVRAVTDGGASAVAAASLFHFTEQTPIQAKRRLAEAGIPVRLPPTPPRSDRPWPGSGGRQR